VAPTTWTALLLLLVAVLPGATFTFGFERQVSAYGVTLADRVLRFVAVSVAFDLLYAWPAYAAYRLWVADRPPGAGQFALAWAAVVVTAGAPAVLGSVVGGLYATRTSRLGWAWLRRTLLPPRREARLFRIALGRDPAPRAWDDFFSDRPEAYLRVRTTSGEWLGGWFGTASYAGGFPQEPDLLIEQAWPVRADGTFGDAPLGYPLYIPAATIAHLEVVPLQGTEEESGDV
jgi:hypothetical protein